MEPPKTFPGQLYLYSRLLLRLLCEFTCNLFKLKVVQPHLCFLSRERFCESVKLPTLAIFITWIGCKFLKTSSAGSFCLNSSFLNLTLFSCIVLQSEKRTQATYSTVDLEISSVKYLRPSLIRSIFNLYNKNHAYSILE